LYNDISYLHEEIIPNVHPITMQRIGNIELIYEMSSSQTALELSINPHEQIHKSSLGTISILQRSSRDFIYVIGEYLKLSFTQCFPWTIFHHLSSQYVWYVKYGPTEIFIKNEALQLQPIIMSEVHCLTFTLGMNDTTHFETLAQDTLHTNFVYESHSVRHSLSNFPWQS